MSEDLDLETRRLCPDGSCIGVIGSDGKCKVCGAADDGAAASAEGVTDETDDEAETETEPEDEADDADDEADDADDEADDADDADDDADDADDVAADEEAAGDEPSFEAERELCPDGNCIGVIGPDGKCKVCGKRAASKS